MNKKELLIEIFTKLLPHWELAEGFLFLIKESDDDEFIQGLLIMISDSIRNIKDKNKQKKVLDTIKKIQKKSSESAEKDQKEADELLIDLSSLY